MVDAKQLLTATDLESAGMSGLLTSRTWRGPTLTRAFVGAALGAACLWLAFRRVPVTEVLRVLAAARPAPVALAVAAIIGATVLRACRWKLLFPPGDRALRFGRLWAILVVGQMINILVPARIGDLSRLYLVERVERRAMPETLGTLGLEKAFDSLVFIVLLWALSLQANLPESLDQARHAVAVTSAGLLVALGVTMAFGERALNAAGRSRLLPARVRHSLVERWLRPLLEGLTARRHPGTVLAILIVSFLTWGAAWLANYACLEALHIAPSPVAALVVLVVLQLGTAVATSPGSLGVFEYLCVLALGVFQVGQSEAVGYGILLHVVAYLPPVALGAGLLVSKVVPWSRGLPKTQAGEVERNAADTPG